MHIFFLLVSITLFAKPLPLLFARLCKRRLTSTNMTTSAYLNLMKQNQMLDEERVNQINQTGFFNQIRLFACANIMLPIILIDLYSQVMALCKNLYVKEISVEFKSNTESTNVMAKSTFDSFEFFLFIVISSFQF